MTPLSATASPLSLQPRVPSDREKLSQAAQQFEAIFVRQMLASARAAKLGGDDALFGGQGLDTFRQMQDEHFADIAARQGALGFAKSLETQLAAAAGLAPAAPAPGKQEG
ncbi:rod-binding protein [Novosphingobium aerophilum]|uniref:Rod-binding protein n=1 Tax=Novosphingobium aerophilum TaxID=2839843 RepID=A0A7X1KCD2_9SPHN|nr:rod-binding protein [Novosphingobium aerophilum]MBC2652158.1 rod-binding protein [Novosphingobium aerophilum]